MVGEGMNVDCTVRPDSRDKEGRSLQTSTIRKMDVAEVGVESSSFRRTGTGNNPREYVLERSLCLKPRKKRRKKFRSSRTQYGGGTVNTTMDT